MATATDEATTYKKVEQKPLPYDIGGLEPVISKNLMENHYGKHHATYVANLNGLYEKASAALASGDHQSFVDISQGIKFNSGGHLNHEFFWENLAPVDNGGGVAPTEGKFYDALCANFGSVDAFITHFSTNTTVLVSAGVQGSGWGWLAYNKNSKELEFRKTANQDRLVDQGAHLVPLLTIDIWEHAYYIDYRNVRPNFMKEIWKIVNWKKVEERYKAA
jgi:Fe-Mn family superoxide dismutase